MMLAQSITRRRVRALPGKHAFCPSCSAEVLSKCGDLKVWHWAHCRSEDCDSFSEPETAWHIGWKSEFDSDNVEVTMGQHRADVITSSGSVIELQHSPISTTDIEERERFYGDMVWLIDADPFSRNLKIREKEGYVTFRWKWPRKSWAVTRVPVFLDRVKINTPYYAYGERIDSTSTVVGHLLRIRKIHWDSSKVGGWGRWVSREHFIDSATRETP